MIHLCCFCFSWISHWNRNLPHCWPWCSGVPGCPIACSWKTLDWQTSHLTPFGPPCYHSRSSCGLQGERTERKYYSCTPTPQIPYGVRVHALTGTSEGVAEVYDRHQLGRVNATSSQQLHKISWFWTSAHGPLWTSTHAFNTEYSNKQRLKTSTFFYNNKFPSQREERKEKRRGEGKERQKKRGERY